MMRPLQKPKALRLFHSQLVLQRFSSRPLTGVSGHFSFKLSMLYGTGTSIPKHLLLLFLKYFREQLEGILGNSFSLLPLLLGGCKHLLFEHSFYRVLLPSALKKYKCLASLHCVSTYTIE